MKRIILLIAIPGVIVAAVAAAALVFFSRPPVLIVASESLQFIYGESRIRRHEISASLALFRPVRTVTVADGAGADVVVIAASAASPRPFCVLFVPANADAAARFHGEFPEIPVVVMAGLAHLPGLPPANGIFCVFSTDRSTDMYRAGLFAGILAEVRQNEMGGVDDIRLDAALLHDHLMPESDRELFSRGLREENPDTGVLFASSIAGMPDAGRLSSAVLASSASEFLDRTPFVPMVLFTWLNPLLLPNAVKVVFDDSPWALAVPAARMAAEGRAHAVIPSKPLIVSRNFADNNVLRRMRRAAEKIPENQE